MTVAQKNSAAQGNAVHDAVLREQLLSRKEKLESSIAADAQVGQLTVLLQRVDDALRRMDEGTFGICETCHDAIENDRLLVDPLLRNCLDHLSPTEQRTLERDLDLAYQIQTGLLPKSALRLGNWETAFHYEPAGPVSGDYCDLIPSPHDPAMFYFLIGDVSGKGIAASLLMANLHAIFRSLVQLNLPVNQLLERANRIFCEGTMTSYFATLVCGRARGDGEIELSNAGHCFPMHVRHGSITSIPSTGLPLGVTCEATYSARTITLAPGELLFLYSDGLTESRNALQSEYGEDRLGAHLTQHAFGTAEQLIGHTLEDLNAFLSGAKRSDDLTLLVVKRGAL
jgi:sigma-B regulation protein RsbU (phosphoserine phosphatase)